MVDKIGAVIPGATWFNIVPRYTPGSPALVRVETARRVAQQEQDMFDVIMAGREGGELRQKAQKLGLRGIVEERWEFRGKHMFRDLLTGETGLCPEAESPRKVGPLAPCLWCPTSNLQVYTCNGVEFVQCNNCNARGPDHKNGLHWNIINTGVN